MDLDVLYLIPAPVIESLIFTDISFLIHQLADAATEAA